MKSSKESDDMMAVVESAHLNLMRAREISEDEEYLQLVDNHYKTIMSKYKALLAQEAEEEERGRGRAAPS